ncbi:phorbol-12-myristate-13-acetate-induced protein 1 [Pygocentrus nattereri]|nr:phorbol-12-myristate-13-acetate-induced protein 1 [Pygocentrus nattereri]
MASKEQTVVAECAQQLRVMGDLIHWKYVLLSLLAKNYKQMQKIK